jgi:Tol biopolymer transport system component
MTRRNGSTVGAAAFLAVAALLAAPASAPAAFPGKNGRIAFTAFHVDRTEPCPGNEPPAPTESDVVDQGIFTMNPDGSRAKALTQHRSGPFCDFRGGTISQDLSPAFSANGKRIAYHSYGPRGIWIMGADGANPRRVFGQGCDPAFSPGGGRIAFSCYRRAIWIMRTDGTRKHRVTDDADSPTFFPGGKRIVFTPLRGGGGIFTIRTDGSQMQRVTSRGFDPDVSPDGHLIVFEKIHPVRPGQDGASSDIYLMRADGSQKRPLTAAEPGEYNLEPVFSPNGKRIAFTNSHRPGISVMRADGSRKQAVIPDPLPFGVADPAELGLGEPSWGPRP